MLLQVKKILTAVLIPQNILHCMLTAQNGHYESARITKKKKECEMTM